MPAELDHLFVMVSAGGSEADRLVAEGLSEGQPNRHPGQGTACRRFFFVNAYLELLWVENPMEAQGEVARPLHLWERWEGRTKGTSPFGVVLRPSEEIGQAPPFPAWEYRPPYLPPSLALHVGENHQSIDEPLLVYFPLRRRPDAMTAPRAQPLEHAAGLRELTGVRIFGPEYGSSRSAAMQAALATGAVGFYSAQEHFAELGFDGETERCRTDLRPLLPLVLCT
jgi:Glyoxalase-like domain